MAEPLFSDRALQETYRALIAESGAGDHLDEDTWDELAANTIDPARRDTAFDHVLSCEHCTRIWRGVLALKQDAETQGLIAPEAIAQPDKWPARRSLGQGGWRSQLVPLAAAASVIVVAGAIYLSQRRPDEADLLRNTGTTPAIGALMVGYAANNVPAFVWAPVADAAHYRLEVFTDDGRPVWSRDVERPPAEWPAEAPRSAGTYRWRVQALRGNTVIAQSPITTVEIKR